MTIKRAYYLDAYTDQFAATVAAVFPRPEHQAVDLTLDQSFFYPTSGGQPHDLGSIEDWPVVDVFVDEATQTVVHRLEAVTKQPIVNQKVGAKINWKRRFDHMQQHTGQHILSQAFVEVAEADTIGFHLGAESCTIDLNKFQLNKAVISAAESLANRIVFENRPVSIRFVSLDEMAKLPLRKRPKMLDDQIRLIEIEGFDLNACGGTHVHHTGEVGIIKVNKIEKRKEKLRVEFRCGWRALAHYQTIENAAIRLSSDFTTSIEAVPAAAQKLQKENKQLQKQLKAAQKSLISSRAAALVKSFIRPTSPELDFEVLVHCVDRTTSTSDLRQLANELTKPPDRITLLAHPDGAVVFKKSANLPGHLGELLQETLKNGVEGSGGGGPDFAQANLTQASKEQIDLFLAGAKTKVISSIKQGLEI